MAEQRNINVRNNADTFLTVRWLAQDGTPYQLSAVLAQIRPTDSSATILATAVITLGAAPEHWATLRFRAVDIDAADFESLTDPAVWDCVLTRQVDGAKAVGLEGRVLWSRGVSR